MVIYRKDEKEPFEKTGLKEENLSKQDKKILQGRIRRADRKRAVFRP